MTRKTVLSGANPMQANSCMKMGVAGRTGLLKVASRCWMKF
jgi:hypothetical protein